MHLIPPPVVAIIYTDLLVVLLLFSSCTELLSHAYQPPTRARKVRRAEAEIRFKHAITDMKALFEYVVNE